MNNTEDHGAHEHREWVTKVTADDSAFRDAMHAAGYTLVTITTPCTQYPRVVPHQHEPFGASCAQSCVDVGLDAGRGTPF